MRTRIPPLLGLLTLMSCGGCPIIAEVNRATKEFGEQIEREVEKNARTMLGPQGDKWPMQNVDNESGTILDRGLETAKKRTSLDFELRSNSPDPVVEERITLRVRWKKPMWLRIDVDIRRPGKNDDDPVAYYRLNEKEWRVYNPSEKSLTIGDGDEWDDYRTLRCEPMPWFFPDKFDLRRKRWKIEKASVDKGLQHLRLTPANDQWPMESEIWLDVKTGMPKRYLVKRLFDPSKFNLNLEVVRLEENAKFDDSVFKPLEPDALAGWKVERITAKKREGDRDKK